MFFLLLIYKNWFPACLKQVSWFSFDPEYHVEREQMSCYLTRTTEATHQLIRDNLHETPTYGGWVEAKGPRYCPSIEDKVHAAVLNFGIGSCQWEKNAHSHMLLQMMLYDWLWLTYMEQNYVPLTSIERRTWTFSRSLFINS